MASALIDTHTHLGDRVFDRDRSEVLDRARAVGVSSVVAVTETLGEVDRLLALRKIHPELRLAFGLYPTYLDREQAQQFVDVIRLHRNDIVAIGEVGLDRWKVKAASDRELQLEIFLHFVDLAKELDLPLNVHSRSAGHYAIAALIERGAKKVQLHAFDGKASKAVPAVEAGYYFSIPASVVHSVQKQKLVKALPLERLLVETDSPVLSPRLSEEESTRRNEPANVVIAVREIARLKELDVEHVQEVVLANTVELYGEGIH